MRKQIHALFGDAQAEEGGYQSCYDGKWIDMTNEVCAVADFIKSHDEARGAEIRIKALQDARDVILYDERAIDAIDEYVWQERRENYLVRSKEDEGETN